MVRISGVLYFHRRRPGARTSLRVSAPGGREAGAHPVSTGHDRAVEADGDHVLGQRQARRAVLQPRPVAPDPGSTVMTICRLRRRGYRLLSPQSGKQRLLPERCISVMGRPCWPVTDASARGSGGDDFGGERTGGRIAAGGRRRRLEPAERLARRQGGDGGRTGTGPQCRATRHGDLGNAARVARGPAGLRGRGAGAGRGVDGLDRGDGACSCASRSGSAPHGWRWSATGGSSAP